LKNIAVLTKHQQWNEIGQKIGNRLYSKRCYYGMVNRIADPIVPVEATIPTEMRELRDDDVRILFDIQIPGLSQQDVSDRLYGRLLVDAGIRTCYVAVTPGGLPCAAVWLISAADNPKLQNISNGNFPLVAPDDRLIEGAFTLNEYRNWHVMASCFARVIAMAKASGARQVIAFVHSENTRSLRALVRSGFNKYAIKREKWFLFFRSLTFEELPGSTDVVSKMPDSVVHAGRQPARSSLTAQNEIRELGGSQLS